MPIVQMDPNPNHQPRAGAKNVWLDLINEVRQEQKPGQWFRISENVAVQKVYDLRKSHGSEFDFEYEYLVDEAGLQSKNRIKLFARLKVL